MRWHTSARLTVLRVHDPSHEVTWSMKRAASTSESRDVAGEMGAMAGIPPTSMKRGEGEAIEPGEAVLGDSVANQGEVVGDGALAVYVPESEFPRLRFKVGVEKAWGEESKDGGGGTMKGILNRESTSPRGARSAAVMKPSRWTLVTPSSSHSSARTHSQSTAGYSPCKVHKLMEGGGSRLHLLNSLTKFPARALAPSWSCWAWGGGGGGVATLPQRGKGWVYRKSLVGSSA
jgi:hypothetical protein